MNNNILKSSQHPLPLNPYFITGLIDSDGSLGVVITPKPTGIGWQVQLQFSIAAGDNYANRMMFDSINLFFGEIGRIVLGTKPNTIAFVITGLNNCVIIRNHLQIYSLMTYKLVYFQL
jgi:LAGLIDADG endonuclease